MADLVLDWAALGGFGTNLDTPPAGGVSTTVDTGGIAVDITFTAQDAGAEAFTANYDGYVPAGSDVDPNSHLKLYGDGGDGGAVSATSTTVMDFRSTDALYTGSVQNVSFLLNDVDGGAGADLGDLADDSTSGTPTAGTSFQDNVTILAYDAEGNSLPVDLQPFGSASVSGVCGVSRPRSTADIVEPRMSSRSDNSDVSIRTLSASSLRPPTRCNKSAIPAPVPSRWLRSASPCPAMSVDSPWSSTIPSKARSSCCSRKATRSSSASIRCRLTGSLPQHVHLPALHYGKDPAAVTGDAITRLGDSCVHSRPMIL